MQNVILHHNRQDNSFKFLAVAEGEERMHFSLAPAETLNPASYTLEVTVEAAADLPAA